MILEPVFGLKSSVSVKLLLGSSFRIYISLLPLAYSICREVSGSKSDESTNAPAAHTEPSELNAIAVPSTRNGPEIFRTQIRFPRLSNFWTQATVPKLSDRR